MSPLARRSDRNPFVTERFEFFVGGREIANGFSELNDAEDQAARAVPKWQKKKLGMTRQCIMMQIIFVHSSTVCHPLLVKESVLIVW